MNYTIRNNCIFCINKLSEEYFDKDLDFPISSYSTNEQIKSPIIIPYNIYCCTECKTYQTKYLGDLNIIYSINHADAHGSIRSEMMTQFSNLILNNSNVHRILEIGAGNGILSDIITEKDKNIEYFIADPSYFGNTTNKIVIRSFIENVDIESLNIDTIVISHVFEHLYSPLDILSKFKHVKHVYLNFPDLETYIKKNTYHVLNPEHVYYVENDFISDLFNNYKFETKQRIDFNDHSVFFEFHRNDDLQPIVLKNKNSDIDIKHFFDTLKSKIEKINTLIETVNKPIYLWPCSMHSIFLSVFGLNMNKIDGFVDNSSMKIDKYLYGFNKPCYSFKGKEEEDCIVLISGGCFNKELSTNDKYKFI